MDYPCGTKNGTLNGSVRMNKLFIILLLLSGLWATHIAHSLVQTFPEFLSGDGVTTFEARERGREEVVSCAAFFVCVLTSCVTTQKRLRM